MDTLKLNKFALWFHNPNDINWEISGYHKILNFESVEEFWVLYNLLKQNIIQYGMYFLMKSNIQPIWEAPENINGAVISIKIVNTMAQTEWEKFSVYFIAGAFGDNANGISISPKKNFNIVKIWYKDTFDFNTFKLPAEFSIYNDKLLYKKNIDNKTS